MSVPTDREQVFTPDDFADRMIAWAEPWIPPGPLRVLEPTAGQGALAAAVLRWGASRGRLLEVSLVERDPTLVAATHRRNLPGVDVRCGDVLDPPPPPASFDLVIANPPWVRESGNAERFRALRATEDGALVYRRNADLHHFFWWPCMRALRPGGVLIFLVPAAFLDSEAAEPVRRLLLQHGQVRAVWRSGSTQVFREIGVESAVVIWTRGSTSAMGVDARKSATSEGLACVPDAPGVSVRLSPAGFRLGVEVDPAPGERTVPLGALVRIVEGVSTGADRLRARDLARVADGVLGEGILLVDDARAAALSVGSRDAARVLRRRVGHPGTWVLRLRDGDLPALDEGAPDPQDPLHAHLLRFRPVLEGRAEMRRNRRRSWYAAAWPRAELDAPRVLWMPKWATRARVARVEAGEVATTDQRVLLPRADATDTDCDALAGWLGGEAMDAWFRSELKRKGAILEFHGVRLAAAPVPERIARGFR